MHRISTWLIVLLIVSCHAATAHHSFAVHYDSRRIVTISGVVTRYAYKMPHIEIDVSVNEDGETTVWKVETINARLAATYALMSDSLKAGDPVEVKGWPAKDGSKAIGGHQIALPDGEIFVLRRAPNRSPTRFRTIHGFTGGVKSPSPRELAATHRANAATRTAVTQAPSPSQVAESNRPQVGSLRSPVSEEELDPQLEFVEQMEEASFAIAALKELLEDNRSLEGQLAEIENLQVALFNSKVLLPLVGLSETAKDHFNEDTARARFEMKKAFLTAIRLTLSIESAIESEKPEAALETLQTLMKHQQNSHRIFQ